MGTITRMKHRVRYSLRIVRLRLLWVTSHYYIVSFPKSGRTWVRIFLAKYLSLHFNYPFDPTFRWLIPPAKGVPRIMFIHSGLRGEIMPKRRKGYMATSEMLSRNIADLAGKDIILLVRDPRDTVVSHYFSAKKRSRNPQLMETMEHMSLSDFIRHAEFGINAIISYLNAWYEAGETFRSFTIIRYEDLRRDEAECFKTLLSACGITKVNSRAFREALAFSSFENMRKLEEKRSFDETLQPGNMADLDSYKVRKGEVGGYKSCMNENDLQYVNQCLEALNTSFDYTRVQTS